MAEGCGISARSLSTGLRIAMLVPLSLVAALAATGCGGASSGSSPSDIEVDAFVRGAAPGGIAGAWESDGTRIELADDGSATIREGNAPEATGFWRQTDGTQGEVILDDGRTMGLSLSGDDLTLSDDPTAPGGGHNMTLHRGGAS